MNSCGSKEEVGVLIAGIEGHICENCTNQAYAIVSEEFDVEKVAKENKELESYSPKEIKSFLDDYVIGQERAKFKLKGEIKNYNNQSVIIKTYVGTTEQVLGKSTTSDDGKFYYKIDIPIKGVVILDLEGGERMEFFADKKNVEFTSRLDEDGIVNIEFQNSKVNQYYEDYKKRISLIELKDNALGVKSEEELKTKIGASVQTLMDKVGIETNRGQHVLNGVVTLLRGNGIDDIADEWLDKGSSLTCKINDELKATLNAYETIQLFEPPVVLYEWNPVE
ncbi:unnamed protein product, partial [Cyprideis torosa]